MRYYTVHFCCRIYFYIFQILSIVNISRFQALGIFEKIRYETVSNAREEEEEKNKQYHKKFSITIFLNFLTLSKFQARFLAFFFI